MSQSSRMIKSILLGSAFLLILSACATATPVPPTAVPAATAGPTIKYDVQVINIAGLGNILVGDDGMTLYVFTKDTPGVSTCTGACAQLWPPETIEPGQTPTVGPGVNATVGSLILSDGIAQITINNMPVYNYAPDKKPGDVLGQGFKGVWYVLDPTGAMVKTLLPTPGS
jgi:predicted lipoprotein with Yx(FWY)xxD motif